MIEQTPAQTSPTILPPEAQPTSEETAARIIQIKQLRVDLDPILQRVRDLHLSGETFQASINLTQSIMWLGMELKRLGAPNPYPNSRDVSNTIVDPTADGLKL